MSLNLFQNHFTVAQTLGTQSDLTLQRMIALALKTSNDHDRLVQQHLTKPTLTHDQSWVVTQYRVCQRAVYQQKAPLVVSTCLAEANRFMVNRYFKFTEQDVIIAEVFAQYVVLDLVKRRMVRIDVEPFNQLNLVVPEIEVDYTMPQPSGLPIDTAQRKLEITPDLIDGNQHVNNLVYVDWATNATPTHTAPSEALIKYGSEILLSDQVTMSTSLYQEGHQWVVHHEIYNQTKQKIASTIQVWYDEPVEIDRGEGCNDYIKI